MLERTLYSDGKNNFKDYTFSSNEWSAPDMVSPEEIRNRVTDFRLEGRTIADIRIIGLSYDHRRDWIEEHAYRLLEGLDEEIRQEKSTYCNIADDTQYDRYVRIDEPLLIRFDDEDVFEIDTPQQPEFRMSMNCIPWWIDAGTNLSNADAAVVFSPCIGAKIESVSVNTYITDKDPMFSNYFDERHSTRELVSDIVLWLDNGYGLKIGGWYDYCMVDLVDKENKVVPISFKELKEGLFNWEDLHIDDVTGFESESGTVFFGRLGAKHAGNPQITIAPDGKESKVHIAVSDFDLFAWSITDIEKNCFDEYEGYSYSYKEWMGVLSEAQKLIDFETFDELFEYRIGLKITYEGSNVALSQMNCRGAAFWKSKERYKDQLDDIRKWTELVLSTDGIMKIVGC